MTQNKTKLTISCKDVAIKCDFVGKANTEEELMMQLVGHIVKVHQCKVEDVMNQEMREKIREHIQKC